MNRVIIHNDNLAAVERGHEEFFHKEQHRVPIDRTGDTQAGAYAVQAQRADGRHVAALISRDLIKDPLARGGAAVQAGQAEMTAHLVNKDEGLTRKPLREFPKLLADLFVPLTGEQTFFSEAV